MHKPVKLTKALPEWSRERVYSILTPYGKVESHELYNCLHLRKSLKGNRNSMPISARWLEHPTYNPYST